MKHKLNLLILKNVPIIKQLQIEEALLRLNNENWCIINDGSPPYIVMGVFGDPKQLINGKKMEVASIPLIKRYSGGGTVVVDSNTLFVSFIFQKEVYDFSCFPESVLYWTEEFYKRALSILDFQLRGTDYAIGDLKCGGNAQYFKKERFAHHTTFLWDYEDSLMDYLLYPKKTPSYRKGRRHTEFLCRLKQFLPSKSYVISRIIETFSKHFNIIESSIQPLIPLLNQPHRRTTTSIEMIQ